MIRPGVVDLESAASRLDHRVHARTRKPARVEKGEKAIFELATSDVGASVAGGEDPGESARAACMPVPHEQVFEGKRPGEPARVGLVDGALEALTVEHRGQVEERARERRDGDAVYFGHVVSRQSSGVEGECGPRVPRGPHRHVDVDTRGRADLPERSCGPMAEHRANSAREYGRHPAPMSRDRAVSDGIDAAGGVPPLRAGARRAPRSGRPDHEIALEPDYGA